jgi:hypothetical protein
MSPIEVAVLGVSAGVTWPLLTVAIVQAAGLLALAKGFRLLKRGTRGGPQPSEVLESANLGLVPAA